jgi:hypothetical protein
MTISSGSTGQAFRDVTIQKILMESFVNGFLVHSIIIHKKFPNNFITYPWASFRVEGVAVFCQDCILPSSAKFSTHSHHLVVLVDISVMDSSSGFSLVIDMCRK